MPCGLLYQALRHCHEDAVPGFRLMHRDVKPDNIGFLEDGRPAGCEGYMTYSSELAQDLHTTYHGTPFNSTAHYIRHLLYLPGSCSSTSGWRSCGRRGIGGAYNAHMSQCYLSVGEVGI